MENKEFRENKDFREYKEYLEKEDFREKEESLDDVITPEYEEISERSETQGKKRLTASQTRALKLVLDAVMLILLVLMYKKQVVSMSFHEIGGLVLIGLFLVHHLVNARWIGAATKRFFTKGTSGLVRARYIVDALLLVAFLTIGITGILINKTLFTIRVAGNISTLHYFASALAIILMGVHLGLHVDYVFGKILKKGASKVAKIALAVVLAALIAFGGYSLFTTQFVSYLAAPLQAAQFSHGEFLPSGEPALDGSAGKLPTDISELPEFAGDDVLQSPNGDNAMQPGGGSAPGGDGMQPPQDAGGGSFGGGGGQGKDGGFGGGDGLRDGRGEGGSTNAALLIAQYVSIITLFAAATYGIVKLTGKRKNHEPQDTVIVSAAIGEPELEEPQE